MSKKKKIGSITPAQIFDFTKPKWNGFACGTGVHGKTKYSRKQKHRKDFRDDE